MADNEPAAPPNWRIPKACQECRQRKIKCSGDNPCKTCQLRRTPCIYREVIRQRRKRNHGLGDTSHPTGDRLGLDGPPRPESMQPQAHREERPLSFNNSVSATHMTSPSNKVQLYYGSTSHFALMHEIYRDLTAHQTGQNDHGPHGRVEEAGAGLDMLSFRTIFFGIPAHPHKDSARGPNGADPHIMFLSYDLARRFLDAFLSTLYGLLPIWPAEQFARRLGQIYGSQPPPRTDKHQCILIMALALGSLITEENHAWGDVLYEQVKVSCSAFDDTVNIQTNEVGRPNACFLHLGTAARKAISAGLHKESPHDSGETWEITEERRRTFWYLYIYENWICFHLGRPSSLSRRNVGIPTPEDPFCQALIFLSDAICRSADELYGRHHESLLQMWRIAKSIWDDLRTFDSKMQRALGFGLDKRPQPGGVGVQQTMCITLYYHTILLTFRPFLIFRGRWNQETKTGQDSDKDSTKREIPPWLNEACGYALSAACRTIHFLCESYTANELVRGIRYHGFFLSSSCAAVIFDLMHGKDLAPSHLPWAHATLRALTGMKQSDAVEASILAIQTILKQLNPAYEWIPQTEPSKSPTTQSPAPAITRPPYTVPTSRELSNVPAAPNSALNTTTLPAPAQSQPLLYDFQGNPLEQSMDMPPTTGGTGSGEDLLDFTLSDMGWDFDFSTMDLETFFSVSPAFDAPAV
ncbi:Zn(II)2Cys6 transcription factor [Aspergillus puulaauensis]|uniref:Zn(2)-C6 fungal-type domain-containing protein n=1 Tax=Aspergillus puulaauensis TaxID=1220207 RepID=A0A7R8ATP4_9EURO|nr:uncharacterized protein APUU_80944A [Aspergillus puulaauensis]BCS30641.1 hypothetical protein APUU_80944A [Aspergillus puulaauensis]